MTDNQSDITAQLAQMRRELQLVNATAANAISALETQTELLRTIVQTLATPMIDDGLTDALLRLASYLEQQAERGAP